MALQIIRTPSSSSLITNKASCLLLTPRKPKILTTITNSQKPDNNNNNNNNNEPTPSNQQQVTSPGLGFGSSSSPPPSTTSKSSKPTSTTKNRKKGKRERASIIRRSPVEKPAFRVMSKDEEANARERSKNETAFLLAWLGFGAVILVEGIALSVSGFLPEEWDKFFVKYVYPSFTPTVFVFVAGTVAYGVLKYLQNEQLKDQK